VRVTDAGRAALAEARPKMAAADTRLLKLISGGGRRATFVSLLHDLVKTAATPEPKAPKPAKTKTPKAEKTHKGKKAKKKAA
jgi:hypothetical protein